MNVDDKENHCLFYIAFDCFCCRAEQLPLQLPKQLEKMSLDEIFQISKSPKDNEDLFVQMLFSVPVEYHQYVMPMVANLYGVSEKTRMMPGIVEWRSEERRVGKECRSRWSPYH